MSNKDEIDDILLEAIVGENAVCYNEYGKKRADKAKQQLLSLKKKWEYEAKYSIVCDALDLFNNNPIDELSNSLGMMKWKLEKRINQLNGDK